MAFFSPASDELHVGLVGGMGLGDGGVGIGDGVDIG